MRWVYRAGGQIGNVLYFVVPIVNTIHDVQVGEGCVVIEEGPFGCIEGGPYRPQYALRLEDGRRVTGEVAEWQYSAVGFEERPPGTFELDERTVLSFASRGRRHQMYVGAPDPARGPPRLLLTMNSDEESSGYVTHLVRPTKDLIVFNCGYRHVICLDVSKLPREQPTSVPDTGSSGE